MLSQIFKQTAKSLKNINEHRGKKDGTGEITILEMKKSLLNLISLSR